MNWNPRVWYSESRQFLTEVRAEYRKVTWPSQKEAIAGTIGVRGARGDHDGGALRAWIWSLGQLIQLVLP